MKRFFTSLKTEWMLTIGWRSFDEVNVAVSAYIAGYYSLLRHHSFNGGLRPAAAEANFEVNLLPCDQI